MAIGPVDANWLTMVRPQGLENPIAPAITRPTIAEPGTSFSDLLLKVVGDANRLDHQAADAGLALAEGRSDDIHGTMVTMQEAGIQMRLVGSIKNKVVDAFYEMWRMNI
jgi:flagellar hook-basal body complex protein FliE